MKNIKLLTSIIALSCFTSVNAATTSAPMQISTAIQPVCLVTIQNMDFSTIQLTPGTSNTVSANSNFTVECTKDTAYTVSMNGGTNLATDGITRRLKHATSSEYLNYGLTLNGTNIQVNQNLRNGIGVGIGSNPTPIQIIGSINTNQTVIAGNYSDMVTMTVEY